MKPEKIWIDVIGCVLGALIPFTAVAATDVDSLLRKTEAVRTSDPHAFAAALTQLDEAQRSATRSQKQKIKLLRAYQRMAGGKYDTAIREALSVYEESPETSLKFRAALLVANGAAITREFSLGLRYLESALALQDQVSNAEERELGSLTASILYNQYGQFALGQHFAERLLAQDASPRSKCFAQQLRIEALFGLGVSLDDETGINTAISQCAALREPIATNLLRGYLARHWASKGKISAAIELLETNLKEVEDTGYPRLIGEINGLLAEYRLRNGDIRGAEIHAHRALKKGGNDAYSLPLVSAHKVLYEAALRRDDLKTALNEYRQYAESDKARLDEVKAREFAFQLSRHELQQKNQSIELLQRQNDVLRLQQDLSKKSAQNNQLLVAMLLMVLGVGAYWAYKIKRVQMMFRRQAQVDSLTGISNRGHFREEAEVHLARCKATGKEAALVLLDLDNFKRINDRYGHTAGDSALRQVAAACHAACREGDLFGRLGGEEFAILSCGADLHAAERIAQQCRERLAVIDSAAIGEDAPAITASFGCATTRLSGDSFESLFMHADRAMYRAKAEGRDRVCTHEERPVLVRTSATA
ncbi:GGDEF domain-containing protein [Lysobacter solisilvae (ex Woo and Kim 2020)]|uniref:diguanylate cyclase n=1 Tax=Agrilutibacter terrestris TaxID=2865112 RepID=A0A7H0FTW9_9GAMM|nr:GGDEF domain-containing protein [Lysobacter terrestris]QNP39485.1 GGDEF domain-containing protein [Lysobacter terrestris]